MPGLYIAVGLSSWVADKGFTVLACSCVCTFYDLTFSPSHPSSPDPGSVLELLQSVLSLDKLSQLLSNEHSSNAEQLEQLQAKLEGKCSNSVTIILKVLFTRIFNPINGLM